MSPLFGKLNLGAHRSICVLDAPASFEREFAALDGVTVERAPFARCAFAIAFVTTQAGLDSASRTLAAACSGDAVLWIAYPKRTSKTYRCEFDRDCGWPVLATAGYEPVRMVAIDEDWSALRFRKVEHIRTMTRAEANAISVAGKRRASRGGA